MSLEQKKLKIYVNNTHRLHYGFNSSFECSNRIEKTVVELKDIIDVALECAMVSIPPKWESIIKKTEIIYKNIQYINCPCCTFKNNIGMPTCDMCGSGLNKIIKIVSSIEGDTTYMCETTCETLVNLLKTIIYCLQLQNKYKDNIFILSRPPGHHSNNESPSGFCLINNMYMAVDYLKHLNSNYKIAIVDWDVHHGNGTQKLFYHRDDILFIDIHRDNFYPYTGFKEEIGEGKGIGFNINIPLEKGSDEKVYINCFNTIIVPALNTFNPDWIMVSCGFDAHINDQMGGMKLESSSYGKFHTILQKLGKPITYMLEGGYNDDSICSSIKEISRYN